MAVIRLSGIDKEKSDNAWKIRVRWYYYYDSETASRPASDCQSGKNVQKTIYTLAQCILLFAKLGKLINLFLLMISSISGFFFSIIFTFSCSAG